MPTTTLLIPYPLPYPTPAVRFLLESWWTCHSSAHSTWRNLGAQLLLEHQIQVTLEGASGGSGRLLIA